MSFWDHLDVLRIALMKIAAVAVVFGVAAFLTKEQLFAIIPAPKEAGFVTYRLLNEASGLITDAASMDFYVKLINTGLAEQFIIHMKTALCAGILYTSPYILYQLFRFVSPALYSNEHRYAASVVGSSYVMFMLGVCVSYFLIFPLTFRFLGNLPSKYGCGEYDYVAVLYLNADSDVAGDGYRVRDTSSFVAFRQTGFSVREFYSPLPRARSSDYPDCCRSHYADIGCVYTLAGSFADVGSLRGEYRNCE